MTAGRVLEHLASAGDKVQRVLDLACGTGAATLPMARAGLRVTGLDRSGEMLEIARERAASEELAIAWVLGDMTDFGVAVPVDLVTCYYDAVNYLAGDAELTRFAGCSYQALRPGGVLAFDINTRRKLEEHWQDSTLVAADAEDRFIVYQSWFNAESNTSPLVMNLFERQEDGSWLRFTEEHVEYAFAIDTIRSTLVDAGFQRIEVLEFRRDSGEVGDFRPGSESSFRVLFLARKPESTS
jgi:SAM-dependent methyltransferase